MAFETVRLIPGFDFDKSPILNETGISDGQFIRWRQGLPEKMGGWVKYYPNVIGPFGNIPRALLPWQDLNMNRRLAVGGTSSLQIITAGMIQDITPQQTVTNTGPNFSTTINSPTVTIIDVNITNPSTTYSVFIQTPVSVGGIVLFGVYPIINVIGANTYQITAATNATATAAPSGNLPVFTTTSGSATIGVSLANHGLSAGQIFPVLVPTTVGGVTISGNYIVQVPVSAAGFFITANTLATSTSAATVTGAFVQSGGSGGPPGAVTLTVVGGIGTAATLTGTISAGGVLTGALTVATPGSYSIFPPSPAAVTDGSLSGATVNLVPDAANSENSGNILTTYYIAFSPQPPFSGWGIGGWGIGGWGNGSSPPTGTGTPVAATDWSLVNFGEILLACPAGGGIYQWGPESAFLQAQLVPQAPVVADGIEMAMPQQILIAWGVPPSDPTDPLNNGIPNALRMRWSDAGNFTVWKPTATNFAGGFNMPRGNAIIRVMQAPNQLLAWTDLAVWSGMYVGLATIGQPVFDWNVIMEGCGLVGRKACGALGTTTYWMSQNQFFAMPVGGVPVVLPCNVRDFVFQNLDRNNLAKVRFFSNAQWNEIGWYFPSRSGGTGENDSYVKFNVVEREWDKGPMGRSAWTDQSILGNPLGGATSGLVYQHEVGYDMDGIAMNAVIVTGAFALGKGEDFQLVDYVVPDMLWGQRGGSQNANIIFTLTGEEFPNDPSPNVQGPFTVTKLTQFFEPRLRSRDMTLRIESQDIGTFWRFGMTRYRTRPDGRNP